jgi:ABC-type nitrate/sulfonate/bicarbonate transport system substrate-binding protein
MSSMTVPNGDIPSRLQANSDTRRKFLRSLGLASAVGIAGCAGGGDGGDDGDDGTATPESDDSGGDAGSDDTTGTEDGSDESMDDGSTQQLTDVTLVTQGVANTPSYAYRLGMEDTDEQYGLDASVEFFTASGIIQSQLLTDEAIAGTNGVEVIAQAVEQGSPIRIYEVAQAAPDYVMVGKEDIGSISDLEGRTVGIEGRFENAWVFTVLPMRNAGADPETVNFEVIGFSSSRTQATLAGSVEATPLHIDQARRVLQERDDYQIVGTIAELLPNYTQTFWVTSEQVLQNRREELVNTVKTSVASNRRLREDFEYFQQIADSYQYEIPESLSARELWEFFVDNDVWLDNPGMSQERFDFMWELMQNDLQLSDDLPPVEDVVDFSIAEDAMADL